MQEKITINLKNNYVYNLIHYKSADYKQYVSSGEISEFVLIDDVSLIIEVPGMGSILIQFLDTRVIEGFEDAAHKSIKIEQPDNEQKIITEKYTHGAIVRYKNKELYCKFDGYNPILDLELDRYGTLSPTKISRGNYVLINIPKISIK